MLLPALVQTVAAVAAPEATDRHPALGAFLAGTVAGHLGDNGTASDLLLDALRHDPGQPAVQEQAFLFSALAGRPQAAALAPRVPSTLITTLVLANAAAMRNDWPRAVRIFDSLSGSTLNRLLRPNLLAWAQQGAGRTEDALRTLSQAGSDGPMAGTSALQAGSIAEFAGRAADAASLYRSATTLFSGISLAELQSAGSFLVRTGHPDQADAMLHGLVQQIPVLGMVAPALRTSLAHPAVRSPQEGLARAYLAIAALLQDRNLGGGGPGAKEASTFMLRFALDLQPDLTGARLMMADLLSVDHPQAGLDLLATVQPDDALAPLAALRSGTLLAALGRSDEAVDRLRALCRSFPDQPEPEEALGDVLSDAKRFPEAADAFNRAIADRTRGGATLSGDDWQLLFSRAVALDRENHWSEAKDELQHALALAPTEPFILNYLGYSMTERHEDLQQARLLIQRALDGKPDDGAIRDSLGWVMLRQNDVTGAVRTLERAAEQNPEDPEVNYHLGAAYWAAGRHLEAQDQWRWALQLHPQPSDEAAIRTALRQAGQPAAAAVSPSASDRSPAEVPPPR